MSQSTTRWQPILWGELQAQGLNVVNAIATTLANQPDNSLASPDLALFFAYWERAQQKPEDNSDSPLARHFLEQALERVATTPLRPGLYGGLAGTGWMLAHLAGWVYEVSEDDPNDVIDEVLSEYVGKTPWTDDYDLISGLVGIGVYALERLPQPAGVHLLEQVIARLAELAEETEQGIVWHTSPHLLPATQRSDFPNGYYNLGLSHGVPGVIALLGHAVAAGVASTTARPLLTGAVCWLLAQDPTPCSEAEADGGGYPAYLDDTTPPKPARLAWCYGDVGIAAALLGVARRVTEPTWEAAALRLARRAAQRSADQSGVRDGCLCHGAAGLAHLFNRFYQATGDPLFAQQARYWIEQTLALRQPDQGIAGYCFWRGGQGWEDSPSFLEGAAGIGLALLAAATAIEPRWDRLLLVDLSVV